MKCFWCKRPIKSKETRFFTTFRINDKVKRKTWCTTCDTDEIMEKELEKFLKLKQKENEQ